MICGAVHTTHSARGLTLVSDWVQTLIVGIETGAPTSATRCLLALGLAMSLLASSGDHPPAMVLHVHDILHGLIHNGVLSCRGVVAPWELPWKLPLLQVG